MASLTGTAFKAKRVGELFWIFYSLPFIKLYLNKLNEQKTRQDNLNTRASLGWERRESEAN